MKLIFRILLPVLIVSHFSAKAAEPLSCDEKYQQSTLPGAKDALIFLNQAYGDCDYDSVNEMVSFIRADRKLPVWNHEGYEDPINCALMKLVQAKINLYCEKAMSLQTLQKRISRIDLPRFLDENIEIRDQIPGWR